MASPAVSAPDTAKTADPTSSVPTTKLAPKERAVAAGDAAAALGLGALDQGEGEDYVRDNEVKGPKGLFYLRYQRTYQGLEVVGGEAIVTTNGAGDVLDTTGGSEESVSLDQTTPQITGAAAVRAARAGFGRVKDATQEHLVVLLEGDTSTLAWEVHVEGTRKGAPSVQDVFVDALSGDVLRRDEYVVHAEATGKGNHNGDVKFTTTQSGSSYSAKSTATPGLSCGNQSGTVYTDADNVWGNYSGTDMPTACADVMYAGEQNTMMLKEWAGRDGVNGSGTNYQARVGMTQVNAYWTGSYANFGRNQAGTKQVNAVDVVAHEFGHGVFQFSGGSPSSNNGIPGGMNESTGDILGSAAECYQAQKFPGAKDTCDYKIGEMIDLGGDGPIRDMPDPASMGDPDCAPEHTSSTEVHAGAGPQNHWFYLLAEGSNPTNGMPSSPICSGGPSSITGIGVQKATNIFVNALQRKSSDWGYGPLRVAALNAAKTLYPGSCTEFNATKNAFLGIQVPAQSNEPSCEDTAGFSIALTSSSASVDPGATAATTLTSQTTGGSSQSLALSATGLPAGASATFSPNPVASGSSSELKIATSASTPPGVYPITVSAKGTSLTKTLPFNLTVNGDTGSGPAPDIDVAKVNAHMGQLQSIADSNNGHRRAGSAGYTASVDYVVGKLQAAGYNVTKQRCTDCTYPSDNIIADWPGGDVANTYMFGAHLDSVSAGPGINDNGSGSAAILETALALAEKNPQMENHARFAWWTDEEQGLNGSDFYVRSLSSTAKSQIKAYYNFDMIASTNGGYFINNISSAQSAPMKAYWESLNLAPEENTEGRGRSDDYSFSSQGIPASGYAAGASATKTSAQASKWGGTAGRAYDPCYHASCDSYPSNTNTTLLNRSADGIAYTLWEQTVGGETGELSVSLNPASAELVAGSSATSTVSPRTSGVSETVSLSATGAPSGATVSFSPTSVQTGSSSTMTVQTSASTPAGTYPITVRASGSSQATATFSLTVKGDTGGGGATVTNGDNYRIYDRYTISSPVSSSYNQSVSSATIKYDIYHSCVEDLDIWLVAPNGVATKVESSTYGNCTMRDGFVTKTVNFPAVNASGTWRLQIRDNYNYDSGTLYSWTLTLP